MRRLWVLEVIYSIFNWATQNYDLFDSPTGEANGQRPAPRVKLADAKGKGHQLESLLPVLPRDAVQVGVADKPVGRIAIHYTSSAVGLGAYESTFTKNPWLVLGLIFGGTWVAYKALHSIARSF